MKILIVGSGAREHAIARTLLKSRKDVDLYVFGSGTNPGMSELSTVYARGNLTDNDLIVAFALEEAVDLAVIGPEAPLAAGLADDLWKRNIPCVGPTRSLARIETSKRFTRDLMKKYKIPGGPVYRFFDTTDGVMEFLETLGENFVVKYDGLMGGKGVKVSGDHLYGHAEALQYCEELIKNGGTFLIEEKFEGEEFSLMSFCDGKTIQHMIPVQDHKRAYENDTGPNTGGMGSYTGPGRRLPFLSESDILEASQINRATFEALNEESGEPYRGILYGGFMATADGVKLIEYNARFGDPEAMNLLLLLQTDLVEIFLGIINGTLANTRVVFDDHASVCKYAVPEGYPDNPVKGQPIDVSDVSNPENLFFASVDVLGDKIVEVGSRTVAYVGIADTIEAAEAIAEREISRVRGPLFHRKDIGSPELVQRRIDQMKKLRPNTVGQDN